MSASGRPGKEEGPGSKAVGGGTMVKAKEASGFTGVVSITTQVNETAIVTE